MIFYLLQNNGLAFEFEKMQNLIETCRDTQGKRFFKLYVLLWGFHI